MFNQSSTYTSTLGAGCFTALEAMFGDGIHTVNLTITE